MAGFAEGAGEGPRGAARLAPGDAPRRLYPALEPGNAARPPRARRLGLFGGSFDPVHAGHLHAAAAAQRRFDLDRVVFVPARRPPHKPGRALAPGPDRVAMLELALAGEPSWSVSDLELRRSGPSYTIDTVRALCAELGEPADSALFLVLGSDNLRDVPLWRGASELLERVQPIVVLRDDDRPEELLAAVRGRLPAELLAKLAAGIVADPPAPGRASDLRAALRAGEPATGTLPAVREYARSHGLYGAR